MAVKNSQFLTSPVGVKEKKMNGKSKKVLETESYVDQYTLKNGHSPTYREIQKHFGISSTASYARCEKFRDKMNISRIKEPKRTRVVIDAMVPNEKLEQVNELMRLIFKVIQP